jgi:hypothetical protein
MVPCDFAEIIAEQGLQAFDRLLVSGVPLREQFAYVLRKALGHVTTVGGK